MCRFYLISSFQGKNFQDFSQQNNKKKDKDECFKLKEKWEKAKIPSSKISYPHLVFTCLLARLLS